jgi:hypothetical protein
MGSSTSIVPATQYRSFAPELPTPPVGALYAPTQLRGHHVTPRLLRPACCKLIDMFMWMFVGIYKYRLHIRLLSKESICPNKGKRCLGVLAR